MSELKIQNRQSGKATILDLSGKITITEGAHVLRGTVRNALEEGKKNLVIRLADVTYLDSSGLGELISSYTTTTNQGGKLCLLSPTQKIMDLLMITKLITVFQVHDTEQEAVNSFN
ncbi:MAG: anti-sigma factor antagonist [Myxococcaceae bacterium]|nr:MAG: anti-sigma factor antagonist [Myxococcaceae bacterium]